MLDTGLEHIETEDDLGQVLRENENVMICCGRMGAMCIPVYKVMEELEQEYPDVVFRDMDFDIPVSDNMKYLPECQGFMGLPFTVYFRKGNVVAATTSIQTREQVTKILDSVFPTS